MASVDMCDHGWPGSGCKRCFPKLMPEQLPETRFLDMAAIDAGMVTWSGGQGLSPLIRRSIIALAREKQENERLRAELSSLKPVPEVDEDAEALAWVLEKTVIFSRCGLEDFQKLPWWPEALAAFKSERPRYTPEQATEIAREICARVADVLRESYIADCYRSGAFDSHDRVTFTKAMLLHETGQKSFETKG